jgi:Cu/Ag efflux pump CusA
MNKARLKLSAFPEVVKVVSQTGRPDDGTDTTGFFNTEYFVDLKPKDEWRPVLLPAATSHGIGSDSQRPFAMVIVGGLIGALLISVFLLPTMYVWIARPHDVLPTPETEFEN